MFPERVRETRLLSQLRSYLIAEMIFLTLERAVVNVDRAVVHVSYDRVSAAEVLSEDCRRNIQQLHCSRIVRCVGLRI